MTLKIHAHLNPEEGGCNYSKYFTENYIENDTIHSEVKKVPVHKVTVSEDPMVMLYDGEKELLVQRGNNINAAELQAFIIDYLGLKTL